MKPATILTCVLLLIPVNALAHPGHEAGAVIPVAVGLASFYFWSILGLLGLGLTCALILFRRRRKSPRADD